MRKRFPYEQIRKGDHVLIYGAGVIGQDLFWQIRSGQYCTLAGITDRRFPAEVVPPFYPTDRIGVLEFDRVIIASSEPGVIAEIRTELRKQGIAEEMIVSCQEFDFICVDSVFEAGEFPSRYAFYQALTGICNRSASPFAGTFMYQSFPALGISGRRDSAERLVAYRFSDYLDRRANVLDIGCNCGFLDLQIAPLVNRITGIDVDPEMIRMADLTKEHLGIENASFQCRDIFHDPLEETFDAVCLFAIHDPVLNSHNISEETFAEIITRLIRADGYLFFESHAYRNDETEAHYTKLDRLFQEKHMRLISYTYHYGYSSGNRNRDISVYRQTPSSY